MKPIIKKKKDDLSIRFSKKVIAEKILDQKLEELAFRALFLEFLDAIINSLKKDLKITK